RARRARQLGLRKVRRDRRRLTLSGRSNNGERLAASRRGVITPQGSRMSQTSYTDPAGGKPQTGPASSTTDWGKAPPVPEITQFLQGPQKRTFELGQAVGIFFEIMSGFRKLHFLAPCVTVFGSARFTEDHVYYALAR